MRLLNMFETVLCSVGNLSVITIIRLIFLCGILIFQENPAAQDREYNPNASSNPTDFANPMYESFPDLTSPSAAASTAPSKISFTDLSTSSDPSSPPLPQHPPPPLPSLLPTNSHGKSAGGFRPTELETDKDTQQLIESDNED